MIIRPRVFALLLPLLGFAASGHAATFLAANLNDLPDAKLGDGICSYLQVPSPNPSLCTLRAAVMEANATDAKDTVLLLPGQTYKLTQPGQGLGAEAGDLNILKPLRIEAPSSNPGPSSRAVVDAQQRDRIFYVSKTDVEIYNVGITGAPEDNMAAVGGAAVLAYDSSLNLQFVEIYNNKDYGILSYSSNLVVEDSEIHDNKIYNIYVSLYQNENASIITNILRTAIYGAYTGILCGGNMAVINSTISEHQGPGIVSLKVYNCTLNVVNSTIAANAAVDGGGIKLVTENGLSSPLTVVNSLFANNAKSCAYVPFTGAITLRNNLYDDDSCPSTGADDHSIPNMPAAISPLGNHGGATPTHRLHMKSLAIDAADKNHCVPTEGVDQRRMPRADADSCDIGSFELEPDVIFWDDLEKML